MARADKVTEADLAEVLTWQLQEEGWSIWPEVAIGKFLPNLIDTSRVIDLVATKGNLAMAIEAKLTPSLTVFEQAVEWTRVFPMVVVAVPYGTRGSLRLLRDHVTEHFGLGFVQVSKNAVSPCHWDRRPRLHRANLRNVSAIASALSPAMQLARAGARHSYRHSPYQETFSEIRVALAQFGPMSLQQLLDYLKADEKGRPRHHYSSLASARSSIASSIHGAPDGNGGIRINEPDIVRNDDGRYAWHPERCRHSKEYAQRLVDCAGRRKAMAASHLSGTIPLCGVDQV
jgi:hypothetical protein